MNIIKGFDRIALVLAIISIVFGFGIGYHKYRIAKTVKIYGNDKPPAGYICIYSSPSYSGDMFDRLEAKKKANDITAGFKEYKTYAPPKWQFVIAGFFGAVIAFPLVLFGLRGLTRLFAWIFAGFRGK